MVMATLAWNLMCWFALSPEESGPPKIEVKRKAKKHRLLRMDFGTFRQAMIIDSDADHPQCTPHGLSFVGVVTIS